MQELKSGLPRNWNETEVCRSVDLFVQPKFSPIFQQGRILCVNFGRFLNS